MYSLDPNEKDGTLEDDMNRDEVLEQWENDREDEPNPPESTWPLVQFDETPSGAVTLPRLVVQ